MGNVFLVCLLEHSKEAPKAIKHFEKLRRKEGWGEGTDGLILAWDTDDNRVRPGSADFSRASAATAGVDAVRMLLFNADGGRAEISGNGLCCLGQAVARHTQKTDLVLDVATDAGHRVVTVHDGTHHRSKVSTSMSVPVVGRPDVNHAAAEAVQEFAVRAVFMDAGNPHIVAQVEDLDSIDMAEVGPCVMERFGDVNVECFKVAADGKSIDMKIWERGVGVTEACGSGAVSVVAICDIWELLSDDKIPVRTSGGTVGVTVGEPMHLTTYIDLLDS